MLGVTVFFTLLIAGLILVFAVRYRSGAKANRRVSHSRLLHWGIEIGWMTVPLAILLVAFAAGAAVYVEQHQSPADPIEVSVVGKQWMWKVAHESGRREINSLHVPAGRAVRLRLTSEDVIHSFFVPVFRVKQDVVPGRYTSMWFEPTKPGRYHLFCAEYCGTDHSRMRGEVVVQSPEEYAAWAAAEAEPPDQAGRRVVETFGCIQCWKGCSAARCGWRTAGQSWPTRSTSDGRSSTRRRKSSRDTNR
jgi:cytochrome c oxidase subunit 2